MKYKAQEDYTGRGRGGSIEGGGELGNGRQEK